MKESRKVALITGASSGIGEDAALRLLEAGFVVYGVARRVERMQHLADRGCLVFSMDVTDEESVALGVKRVIEEQGRLDVLVNNAGYGSYGPVESVSIDEAKRQLDVNLFGLARLVQLVVPHMREQGSGRIINVASIAGRIGTPLGGWYHASKFGLEGLSDALRGELVSHGIRVVVIEPGPVQTEWNETAREGLLKSSAGHVYETQGRRAARILQVIDGPRIAAQPSDVSRKIVRAATARFPAPRYRVGIGPSLVVLGSRIAPDRLLDLLRRLVWG